VGAPKIAVLDYGIGNLRSAEKGLQRAGADATLTSSAAVVEAADAVVLPGVGNFGRCMEALAETGLGAVAIEAAGSGRPFIGICVGMQLMFEGSAEAPDHPGLGIFPGRVLRLDDQAVKVPQMQWNELNVLRDSPMLTDLDGEWMYFVHSYAADVDGDLLAATCEYGGQVAAAVERGSVWATQFHPEKSGDAGRRLLENFVQFVKAA